MTDKTLLQLVITEANNLKKFATKEELRNLDFKTLDGDNRNRCIYGQATGSCFSTRADVLIKQCATRVYETTVTKGNAMESARLNGAPVGNRGRLTKDNPLKYYSPIEMFVEKRENYVNGNNVNLIAYLKGEANELNLV